MRQKCNKKGRKVRVQFNKRRNTSIRMMNSKKVRPENTTHREQNHISESKSVEHKTKSQTRDMSQIRNTNHNTDHKTKSKSQRKTHIEC